MTRSRSNSQSSVKSTTSQKRKIDLNKIEVYLEYSCFICGLVLSSAKTSIEHVKKMHGYDLPSRPKDQTKRPRHHRYYYVKDKGGRFTMTEIACPSCWLHFPENDLECFNEHIRETHRPKKVKEKEKEVDNAKKLSEDGVVKQEKSEGNDKHVKFENDASQHKREDNDIDKINKIDDSAMAELVKAFQRFVQSMQ